MILQGDCLQVLQTLPENSVHTVVTSPPYWSLRDYGVPPSVWGGDPVCAHVWESAGSKEGFTGKSRWAHADKTGRADEGISRETMPEAWDQIEQGKFCASCGAWLGALGLEPSPDLFVAHLVAVFREVRRVLRKDGTAWVNMGDSYNAQPGQRKTTDKVGAKQLTNAGSNSVGSRSTPWLKAKDLVGVPWMLAFALRADGWYLRSDIIWSKPNPMPESTRDRPTKAHEYVFLLAKSKTYYYNADAIREPFAESTLREFETPYEGLGVKDYAAAGVQNPSDLKRRIIDKQRGHSRRHAGFDDRWDARVKQAYEAGERTNPDQRDGGLSEISERGHGANKRSVWTIATQPTPEAHFATFPEDLVEPCIRAGCPDDGTVLDPFAGSGTVGVVCDKLRRQFIGIELNQAYIEIAERRIAAVAPLFAGLSADPRSVDAVDPVGGIVAPGSTRV